MNELLHPRFFILFGFFTNPLYIWPYLSGFILTDIILCNDNQMTTQ